MTQYGKTDSAILKKGKSLSGFRTGKACYLEFLVYNLPSLVTFCHQLNRPRLINVMCDAVSAIFVSFLVGFFL